MNQDRIGALVAETGAFLRLWRLWKGYGRGFFTGMSLTLCVLRL